MHQAFVFSRNLEEETKTIRQEYGCGNCNIPAAFFRGTKSSQLLRHAADKAL